MPGVIHVSRGPGIVQRRLLAAFEAEPSRRFTMRELAQVVWPGEAIGDSHRASLCRALKRLPVELTRCRVGKRGRRPGWLQLVSASKPSAASTRLDGR